MLNSFDIGYDPGNSETSTVVTTLDGEQRFLTIPSRVGRGSFDDLRHFRNMRATQARDILQPGEYILYCPEVDSSECYVGDLALSQSRISTSAFGDNNRYWSLHSRQLLLTTTGALIPDPWYELHVVTGMPIETYSDVNRRKVRDALEGEHHFTLNGRERLAIVHVEKVIMESAGAMIAYGDDRPLRQGVVDLGGRTTDLYTADGQIPLIPQCRGVALGVELVSDIVNRTFQTQYGRALTLQEIRSILRASVGNDQYPLIHVHGQEISPVVLRGRTEEALRSVGRDITTFLSQTWANGELGGVATDMARVLLVGGGAYYFCQEIARLIPHVIVPQQPELANALGYAALARYLRRH
jgi:Actin like proteins N terminal domain